jgi:hypothetical protein
MQEARDTELLRQYVRQNSDEAFAALITRHVNMVYSAALRKTGNPAAAEEITQAVFIILARKADKLFRHTALSGWLYQTTRLTAANFLRTEIVNINHPWSAIPNLLEPGKSVTMFVGAPSEPGEWRFCISFSPDATTNVWNGLTNTFVAKSHWLSDKR